MNIQPFIASTFRSDGGSMFGLVPKGIWSRMIQPDELNRIPQNAHALLVETDDNLKGLVDLGCGSAARFSEKQCKQNGLGPGWPLAEFLHQQNLPPESIDFIIFTHLHWDHCGGLLNEEGTLTFPRAKYFVHAIEWADANSRNPLLGASYPASVKEALSLIPLSQLVLVEEDAKEIMPGIHLKRTSGHTRGHCAVHVEAPGLEVLAEGQPVIKPPAAVFAADVCPTRHHLRLVFQTAYDTYPLDTRAWKMEAFRHIADTHALLLLDHDPGAFGITLQQTGEHDYAVQESYAFSSAS